MSTLFRVASSPLRTCVGGSSAGFVCKPTKTTDGTLNLMRWEAAIPGKAGTPWEGGEYKLQLEFPRSYPQDPPVVRFTPALFHPNVYPDGKICLSIIGYAWKPAITLKEILLGVQELLDTPNLESPANGPAYQLKRKSPAQYEKRIREIAKANAPKDQD
ncbi:E2 SUMO-conjugating protein ubc9 [Allomyces arbusculus]|nr:E2 SUMO-conjugating protein ubc9 [Allomyces arbusculus]